MNPITVHPPCLLIVTFFIGYIRALCEFHLDQKMFEGRVFQIQIWPKRPRSCSTDYTRPNVNFEHPTPPSISEQLRAEVAFGAVAQQCHYVATWPEFLSQLDRGAQIGT